MRDSIDSLRYRTTAPGTSMARCAATNLAIGTISATLRVPVVLSAGTVGSGRLALALAVPFDGGMLLRMAFDS